MPSNNPSDTQKLNEALLKYKSAIDSAQKRDRAIREKIAEAKGIILKKQASIKQGQRAVTTLMTSIKKKKIIVNEGRSGRLNLNEMVSTETRIASSIAMLDATAEMRREQLNQKRNSSTSSTWVQSLPGLPGSLKRSLWYKMHRRRQQIVLRPTFTSLLDDLRKEVENKYAALNSGFRRVSEEVVEAELIRAEQEYLVATHPVAAEGEKIPSTPSSSSWAEPGRCFLLIRTRFVLRFSFNLTDSFVNFFIFLPLQDGTWCSTYRR